MIVILFRKKSGEMRRVLAEGTVRETDTLLTVRTPYESHTFTTILKANVVSSKPASLLAKRPAKTDDPAPHAGQKP